jgi:hypothetical protein
MNGSFEKDELAYIARNGLTVRLGELALQCTVPESARHYATKATLQATKLDMLIMPLIIAAHKEDALSDETIKEIAEYLELVETGLRTFIAASGLEDVYAQANVKL